MSSNRKNNKIEVRVELKYCEHCGGLWVRERGSGVVFCDKCQVKVDDLPMRKKRPGRVRLRGVRKHSRRTGSCLTKRRRISTRWGVWHERND